MTRPATADPQRRAVRLRPQPSAISLHRVGAMVLRYFYVFRTSWARIADLTYWPALQMVTWGFLQTYLARASTTTSAHVAMAAGTLIGAVLLWDILQRGQIGFSVTFLEEMWSRNVGNLLMSPLRPLEFVLALMTMSILRLACGLVPVSLLAIWFFGFNLWSLGVSFAFLFANLIFTSWSIGLIVSGLILRLGMGAESVAWTLTFALLPLCAVYYPVAILPSWLQPLAWALPPTYVFEAMRDLLLHERLRGDLMLEAAGVNALLFGASTVAFVLLLKSARQAGSLLQVGE